MAYLLIHFTMLLQQTQTKPRSDGGTVTTFHKLSPEQPTHLKLQHTDRNIVSRRRNPDMKT